MYSPESSIDNGYFYNPMNSLSESEAEYTLQPKSSLICENPPVMAKRGETIINNQSKGRMDSPENYKDVKLPEQSFNKQQQTSQQAKPPTQQSQFTRQPKPSDSSLQKPTPVGTGINDSVTTSARKKPRIFDPINNDVLEQSSFIKELNKMVGEDAMKKHIEPKKITSAEDLIIQKQMFLSTNYNEKNVQGYIEKARAQLEKLDDYENELHTLKSYHDRLQDIGPHCLAKEISLLDQASEDKRLAKAREEFKALYADIARIDTASRVESDQDSNEVVNSLLKHLEIKLKIQFAIENLVKLKPQLSILKNNRNFQIEFQAYIELVKQSQRLYAEILKPQMEVLKSTLKIQANKIYHQVG